MRVRGKKENLNSEEDLSSVQECEKSKKRFSVSNRFIHGIFTFITIVSGVGMVLFGIYGYIGAIILGFIYLATLKSFGKPYMYPLIPFDFNVLFNSLVRTSSPYQYKKRRKKREVSSTSK